MHDYDKGTKLDKTIILLYNTTTTTLFYHRSKLILNTTIVLNTTIATTVVIIKITAYLYVRDYRIIYYIIVTCQYTTITTTVAVISTNVYLWYIFSIALAMSMSLCIICDLILENRPYGHIQYLEKYRF